MISLGMLNGPTTANVSSCRTNLNFCHLNVVTLLAEGAVTTLHFTWATIKLLHPSCWFLWTWVGSPILQPSSLAFSSSAFVNSPNEEVKMDPLISICRWFWSAHWTTPVCLVWDCLAVIYVIFGKGQLLTEWYCPLKVSPIVPA